MGYSQKYDTAPKPEFGKTNGVKDVEAGIKNFDAGSEMASKGTIEQQYEEFNEATSGSEDKYEESGSSK